MAYSSQSFITYSPYPSNKKIKIVDGSFTTVVGQGIIALFPSLPLKNMLHVPMSIKLLSVHQVTKDLDCKVTFYPTYYVFQDQSRGGRLDMLRKMMNSISLRQGLEVAINLHIPIYPINFPSIMMTFSFNTSVLDIHHLVYSKTCFLYY